MSVCMSAVSAGISEVLIKYTGNVWLQIENTEIVYNKIGGKKLSESKHC